MHLTDHISDEQLNEYLDGEASDSPGIELHLSTCEECSARLVALQALFAEIESLPEVKLSRNIAERFMPEPARSTQLPRFLTITLTLQAALAAVAILLAAPFVMRFLSRYLPGLPEPSFADLFLLLQSQWMAWLDQLSTFQFPAIPEIPVVELSSLFMVFIVIGVCVLWLIGNGLLLRNQMK